MKLPYILLILSLLGILGLAIFQIRIEKLEEGTVSSIKYNQGSIRIDLEENKTLIIFTKRIINLKKGDLIEFKENKGFSSNQGEIAADKIWKLI